MLKVLNSDFMQISSNLFSRLVLKEKYRIISCDSSYLSVDKNKYALEELNLSHTIKFKFINVYSIHLSDKRTVSFVGNKRFYRNVGFLQKQRSKVLLEKLNKDLIELLEKIDNYLPKEKYIDHRILQKFVVSLAEKNSSVKQVTSDINYLASLPNISADELKSAQQDHSRLIYTVESPDKVVEALNVQFIEQEKIKYKDFFDTVESEKLTDEQRTACITMEENTLLVAAAGSGKTSTLVGRVGYIVKKKLFEPEEILCLAFNTDAAKEIRLRIKEKVKADVASKTFHSLGYEVIKQNYTPEVIIGKADNSEEEQTEAMYGIYKDVINDLIENDMVFRENWLIYNTVEEIDEPDVFFNHATYLKFIDKVKIRKKDNQETDNKKSPILYPTLSKKSVRSFEELQIANWLICNQVDFKYEPRYEEGAAALGYQNYTPDFYYPKIGVYHEHFGLNEHGKAPEYFDNPSLYEAQAQKKKDVLLKLNPDNFFTSSDQFRTGEIFKFLTEKLTSLGLTLKPLSAEEIRKKLEDYGKGTFKTRRKLVYESINLVRLNGFTREELERKYLTLSNPQLGMIFLDIIWKIKLGYEAELASQNKIDFTSMLQKANQLFREGKFNSKYKFILVDEFQDISKGGAEIVKQLKKYYPRGAVLFAVGDDWQSINTFAGADLNYFNSFSSKFGIAKELVLTKTFRSNQGIANLAANFVQSDPNLRKKVVRAHDQETQLTVHIESYFVESIKDESAEDKQKRLAQIISNKCRDILDDIQNKDGNKDKKKSVFVLNRYGYSTEFQSTNKELEKEFNALYPGLDIQCKTMHRSKGRQADYVIITGFYNQSFALQCFPSAFKDSELKKPLLSNFDKSDDAEERRLLYVALTRAKHKVYVVLNNSHWSAYTHELLRHGYADKSITYSSNLGENQTPKPCKKCNQGVNILKTNTHGEKFKSCSKYKKKKQLDTGLDF